MTPLLRGIRSVELGVADLHRCVDFYERVWSLRLVERTSEATCLRGQGALHHILELRRTGVPGIRRIVFDVPDAAALHELHARLKIGGHPVSERPRRLDAAGAGLGFDARDPEGRNLSFACEVADHPPSGQLPDRITKITHLNLNSATYEVTRAFMVEVLGLRVVDETRVNGFFNCGSDHHCLVVGRRQSSTLNHIAFEMPDLDSVMCMAGTMREAGYSIEWGVGRHGPGNNVFAYFAGPEEIPIECTAEVLQIDDTYRYRGPDEWSFPPGRTDQWGVTGPPSARIKRIQDIFRFPDLPLR
jgi:catechol 2,3-dioxygenase-like lactoylglutathione lyase family enzyme